VIDLPLERRLIMAHKSLAFKKKQHFLQLIKDLPSGRILFCPVDVSKHFHVALLHDIHCQPLSDFFEFSASKVGFAYFISRLEEVSLSKIPSDLG
jgi:hypothetical protein